MSSVAALLLVASIAFGDSRSLLGTFRLGALLPSALIFYTMDV